jgi:uncharacterized protein (TIGR02001 family)
VVPLCTALAISGFSLLLEAAKADVKYGVIGRLTSNYIYRGYSKSNGDPVIQGNIDVEHTTKLFAGAWVSQVDFDKFLRDSSANVELSPYIGWNIAASDTWNFDTSLTGYIYDGDVSGRNANYGELSGQIYHRDLVTARISLIYDGFGYGKFVQDYEVLGRYPLFEALDGSGGVGYSEADALYGHDNLYSNIGATWFFHRYTALDMRYYDLKRVDMQPEDGLELPAIENPLVVSISLGF